MEYFQDINGSSYSGSLESDFAFDDQRSWFEQNQSLLIWLIVFALILAVGLFFLFGYVIFKPRFSKDILAAPAIDEEPLYGGKVLQTTGSFVKDKASVRKPFVPEKATWRFMPNKAHFNPKKMDLEADKNGRIKVTNASSFDGKEIKFGAARPSKTSPVIISPTDKIRVTTSDKKYVTSLTMPKKAKK